MDVSTGGGRRLTIAMVLVALAVTAWVAPAMGAHASKGGRVTGDEPHYLITALSLWDDRSLDVSDEREELAYTEFHDAPLIRQERVRVDGTEVSPHDSLLPAMLAVPMGLGGWAAAKFFLAVLAGALGALLVWVAVRRFAVTLGVAVLTVLAFSLAAPLAFYGTQVYPELPAAFAVTVAAAVLTSRLARRDLVVLALAVVALPWLSVKYAPVAAVLVGIGVARLWQRGDRGPALAFVGALGAAGVGYLALHQLWYEGWTVYASGHHFPGGETTVIGRDPNYLGRSTRLLGLLVDREFGLAAWQPAFLLAVPALVAMLRARPRGWLVLVLPLAAGWLNATFVARTMHGWWWPGRQVVVVAPCAVLAVAWWVSRYRPARGWLAAGAALGAAAVAWLTVEGLLGHRRLVVGFEDTGYPWYRLWRLVLPDGRLEPAGTTGLRALWYVAVVLLALWGWRSVTRRAAASRPPPDELTISEPKQRREAQPCATVPS